MSRIKRKRWLFVAIAAVAFSLFPAATFAADDPERCIGSVPEAVGKPSISQMNRTLKTTNGHWDDCYSPIDRYHYQWFRDGKKVRGATEPEYRLKRGDFGHQFQSVVAAHNEWGWSLPSKSDPFTPRRSAGEEGVSVRQLQATSTDKPPLPGGEPETPSEPERCQWTAPEIVPGGYPYVSGSGEPGTAVPSSRGVWDDCGAPIDGYYYRFINCDSNGNCGIAQESWSDYYIVQEADRGHFISSSVSAHNEWGWGTYADSYNRVYVPPLPPPDTCHDGQDNDDDGPRDDADMPDCSDGKEDHPDPRPSWGVLVCDQPALGGSCAKLTQDSRRLVEIGWNDRIRSFKIIEDGYTAVTAVFFDDEEFDRPYDAPGEQGDLPGTASSIRVDPYPLNARAADLPGSGQQDPGLRDVGMDRHGGNCHDNAADPFKIGFNRWYFGRPELAAYLTICANNRRHLLTKVDVNAIGEPHGFWEVLDAKATIVAGGVGHSWVVVRWTATFKYCVPVASKITGCVHRPAAIQGKWWWNGDGNFQEWEVK